MGFVSVPTLYSLGCFSFKLDLILWPQGANEGKSMEEIASSVGLPQHLRDNDALDELYGQIDWCVAIPD